MMVVMIESGGFDRMKEDVNLMSNLSVQGDVYTSVLGISNESLPLYPRPLDQWSRRNT